METQELTFGMKAVGLTFNPSGDEKVQKAKELFITNHKQMLLRTDKETTKEELQKEGFKREGRTFGDLEARKKETVIRLVKVFEDKRVVKYEVR